MTQTLQLLYFSAVVAKHWKEQLFSTSPSKVAVWQVQFGTKLSTILLATFAINMAGFKEKWLMTETLHCKSWGYPLYPVGSTTCAYLDLFSLRLTDCMKLKEAFNQKNEISAFFLPKIPPKKRLSRQETPNSVKTKCNVYVTTHSM